MKPKNILITGASRGIGEAISFELSQKGFHCITPSSQELNLNCCESIEQYFETFDQDIYGLVNNAGINILSDITSLDDEKFDNMMNINLKAPLKLIQHVSKKMIANRSGKIVNLSSIWGVRSKEYRTLYSITKFGINGMTKALARELGAYNILVNSIAPGYVNTELTKKNVPIDEQIKIQMDIPLGRFAEPSEIAKVVSFLMSEENTYITGQTIIVDGGFLA